MAPLVQSSQPWVEKYRPKQVKDVAQQDEVVRVLTNTLETSNMLFYGPPGTGKTITALAIAHQVFGPELYKSRVLELNASDDCGINAVRTKTKIFAAVAVGSAQRQGGYPCPSFKIIILDEADSMTEDAQVLSTLSSISQGDLRQAITYLQSAARLFGSSISKELISVSGVIPEEVVESFFAACTGDNFDLANNEVNNVIADGYPVSQMLSQLFEVVVESDYMSDEQKAKICKKMGEADKRLVDGADEYLRLLDVASSVMRAV